MKSKKMLTGGCLIYLIHAHKDIEQLNRLIEALLCEGVKIYVNIDLKSDIDISQINKNAKLIKNRIAIEWGKFNQVQATINSIAEIDAQEQVYSHIMFISGQDYPILSNEKIKEQVKAGIDYMQYALLTYEMKWKAILSWDNRYDYIIQKYSIISLGKMMNKISRKFLSCLLKCYKKSGLQKRTPWKIKLYGGSQWWTLSQDSIKYILSFLEKNKKFAKKFYYVGCIDEKFFQIILCNSPFIGKIENDYHRYINWTYEQRSPDILTDSDYEKIINSSAWFCRKVELPVSTDLLDRIDRYRQ